MIILSYCPALQTSSKFHAGAIGGTLDRNIYRGESRLMERKGMQNKLRYSYLV